MTYFKAFTPPF